MCLPHFQTPPKKKKKKKPRTPTANAEQGRPGVRHSSRIRDGYRFAGTGHKRHFLSSSFSSTVTGQASANRSAKGRKRPGSEGTLRVYVCVRVFVCGRTCVMIRLTATRKLHHSYGTFRLGPITCNQQRKSLWPKTDRVILPYLLWLLQHLACYCYGFYQ